MASNNVRFHFTLAGYHFNPDDIPSDDRPLSQIELGQYDKSRRNTTPTFVRTDKFDDCKGK